ncbi:MAG: type II toxin-antitoxin system HipA family toxin [Ilumatobacter sp.]|uniref:type II toxin-antitoxin system HipA family toxin n=1 Tax=Ilumatobacter sp. TaxID=1967498 RepID=UPI00391D4BD8
MVDDEGMVVGVVSATSVDSLAFDYASGYSGVPLSTSMPTSRTHYTHKTIAPYLWGLLPDDPTVIARWAKKAQVSERNICGLLNHVGADAAGAFRYSNDPAALGLRADGGSTPLSEAEIAERLRGLKADSSRWHDKNDEGRWSLAGAQAKIALSWVDGVGWSEPDGGTPSTHILKPAIAGYESFEVNEYLCLGAADRLGLVAAKTELMRFEDQKVVVVERYDRSHGGTRRIHQEDMCQALGVHPSEKYQSDGGPTPAQIVERLRQVSSDVDVDVERFLLALGYNWLVVGTDAHAKNYSLLIADSVIRLAPLYDIASALPYVDVNIRKRKLAMKLGSTYQPHKVEVRHFEALAEQVRADGEWYVQAMRGLADAAGDAFVDVAAESGSDDCRAMLPPILDWIEACRRVLK